MWRDNELLMHLFEPEELEALVCGGTDLDFTALQQAARYEDGFEETSEVRPALAVLKALATSCTRAWKRLSSAGQEKVSRTCLMSSSPLCNLEKPE